MSIEAVRAKIAAAQQCAHPFARLRIYAVHFDRSQSHHLHPTLVQFRCAACGESNLRIEPGTLRITEPGERNATVSAPCTGADLRMRRGR